MFYSLPADSFNLGIIKMCQTQSIIPTGILSMFEFEKTLIFGYGGAHSPITINVVKYFVSLTHDQNIHCDLHCVKKHLILTSVGMTVRAHSLFFILVVSVTRVYVCACKRALHICISDVIRPPFHMQINLKTWQSH